MAWDLPAGWTESGVEKPFRYATLLAGDAENPVDAERFNAGRFKQVILLGHHSLVWLSYSKKRADGSVRMDSIGLG